MFFYVSKTTLIHCGINTNLVLYVVVCLYFLQVYGLAILQHFITVIIIVIIKLKKYLTLQICTTKVDLQQ